MSFYKKTFFIILILFVAALVCGTYYAAVTRRMAIKAQWNDEVEENNPYKNSSIEVGFSVIKSDHGLDYYGGETFADYLAGERDSGWDFSLIAGRKNEKDYYRLAVSADRDELVLWKPQGGFLAVKNISLSHFIFHKLSLNIDGGLITVFLDGKAVVNYFDKNLIAEGAAGAVGTGRYGNAIVIVSGNPKINNLEMSALANGEYEHIPDFRLINWRGNQWIFDGGEPVAMLDTGKTVLWEAKLKRGCKPSGYWELFWKQYKEEDWYANKLVDIQSAKIGDKLKLELKSVTPDKAVTSFVDMLVSYKPENDSYFYEADTSMVVNEGKSWHYFSDGGLEYLNFEAYNIVPPGAIAIKDVWQKEYEWFLYKKLDDLWLREPINHNSYISRTDSGLADTHNGVFILGVNDNINPTIFLKDDKNWQIKGMVQLCSWAYDSHFRWQPFEKDEELKEGTSYSAHYAISNLDGRTAESIFNKSTLAPSFEEISGTSVPIYRRSLNDFQIGRDLSEPHNEWAWQGNYIWDKTTGHNDNFSVLLDKEDYNQPEQTAFVDSAGPSYFTRLESIPAGIYSVSAYVKTEKISGSNPTISIASKHPAENPIVYEIKSALTTGDWQKISFDAYLPENTGVIISLNFNGKGKVWFDDISWGIKQKDYLAQIGNFIGRIADFLKRHFLDFNLHP